MRAQTPLDLRSLPCRNEQFDRCSSKHGLESFHLVLACFGKFEDSNFHSGRHLTHAMTRAPAVNPEICHEQQGRAGKLCASLPDRKNRSIYNGHRHIEGRRFARNIHVSQRKPFICISLVATIRRRSSSHVCFVFSVAKLCNKAYKICECCPGSCWVAFRGGPMPMQCEVQIYIVSCAH